MPELTIRPVEPRDADAIADLFAAVVAGGDVFAYAPDTPREFAIAYFGPAANSHVAVDDEDTVLGVYRVVANQAGLGDHVANAGYMVAASARGRGIGQRLGEHSLETARRLGFLAMQFNYVVSTNTTAVALWQRLGFAIVGTVPAAYRHATLGFVDVHVMHRFL